jgi:hypothetical protein
LKRLFTVGRVFIEDFDEYVGVDYDHLGSPVPMVSPFLFDVFEELFFVVKFYAAAEILQ